MTGWRWEDWTWEMTDWRWHESWVHHYDSESKRGWMEYRHKGTPSPDLARLHFQLFPKLKVHLRAQHFSSYDDIKNAVTDHSWQFLVSPQSAPLPCLTRQTSSAIWLRQFRIKNKSQVSIKLLAELMEATSEIEQSTHIVHNSQHSLHWTRSSYILLSTLCRSMHSLLTPCFKQCEELKERLIHQALFTHHTGSAINQQGQSFPPHHGSTGVYPREALTVQPLSPATVENRLKCWQK